MIKMTMIGSAALLSLTGAAMAQTPQAFTGPIGGAPGTHSNRSSESPMAVLWDQRDFDVNANAYVNQTFTDFPTYDSFNVSDVTTGGATWNVQKITVYFTRGAGGTDLFNPINITTANVQIYSKTGCLPGTNDLPPQLTLPCTLVSPAANLWEISVDTSSTPQFQGISGNYWIGVTPITNFARDGQEFQFQTRAAGRDCESSWRNPGNGFLFGTEWMNLSSSIGNGTTYDCAILIEGTTGGGGYTCTITGTCPGTVRLAWAGAQPNRQQGIVFARNTGNYTIQNGQCTGTQLGLGTNQLQLYNTIGTGNGAGSVNAQANSGACRGYVQLIQVPGCQTSNVAQVP